MLNSWLEDLSAEHLEEKSNGIPPFVVPNVIEKDVPSDDDWWPSVAQAVWDDVAVLLPWNMYQSSGDAEVLRRQYKSMTTWVDKGVQRGSDGLWDPDLWQLGDWLDPAAPPDDPIQGRTDGTLVADAYLVHVTSILAKASAVLDLKEDAERYRADHNRLVATFQQKYISPVGLLTSDTQTALSLGIVFSLFTTPEQEAKAAQRLARAVRMSRFRVATGFTGTPIITHALTRICEPQLAYRMLLEKDCPSWMYPITQGATTIWERWNSMIVDENGKQSINPGEMTSYVLVSL